MRTPPPDVRQFTIENAAYEICDQTMDIADRGGIPDGVWNDAVETVTYLADRGLLAWVQPNEHGWQPWTPTPNIPNIPDALGSRQTWEYGVEYPWGIEWGASVGLSHRYEYTEDSVHALAAGHPVWRRLRTTTPDVLSEPEPYPNPATTPKDTP